MAKGNHPQPLLIRKEGGQLQRPNRKTLKKTRKTKSTDAPIDLSFINIFTNRILAVDRTKLDQTQKETMMVDLVTTRSSVDVIINRLNGNEEYTGIPE